MISRGMRRRGTTQSPPSYRDVRVWECPPNGQGLAALLALAMLDGLTLAPAGSAERAHLQIEALRLGFADARWYVTDPAFASGAAAMSCSPRTTSRAPRTDRSGRARRPTCAWLAGRDCRYGVSLRSGRSRQRVLRRELDIRRASVPALFRRASGSRCRIADAASSLDPRHPECVCSRQASISHDDPGHAHTRRRYALGAVRRMGGPMQPQGHSGGDVARRRRRSPQEALDRPRFFIEPEIDGGRVNLEAGCRMRLRTGFARAGMTSSSAIEPRPLDVRPWPVHPPAPDGSLVGGSDRRADGCVLARMTADDRVGLGATSSRPRPSASMGLAARGGSAARKSGSRISGRTRTTGRSEGIYRLFLNTATGAMRIDGVGREVGQPVVPRAASEWPCAVCGERADPSSAGSRPARSARSPLRASPAR